jgi:phosphohistidine phosphatase
VRHAKSSWSDRSTTDIDRPLSTRGLQAAEALASHIADTDRTPDIVVCSPAKRARQTLAAMEGILPAWAEIRIEPVVYDAGADELLTTLRDLPDPSTTAMVIGHNPTMQELALRLVAPEDSDQQVRIRLKFPTAALAMLSVPPGWEHLAPGCAHLEEFWTPR